MRKIKQKFNVEFKYLGDIFTILFLIIINHIMLIEY
jgi:hypothetical protein